MSEGPLKLTGPQVADLFITSSTEDIEPGYDTAQVFETNPSTIWILHSVPDFAHEDQRGRAEVITPQSGLVHFGKHIRSAQGFEKKPSIGIFALEHFDFKGYGSYFNFSQPYLYNFPSGPVSGVSSAIITGGTWSFYSNYNYDGIIADDDGTTRFRPGNVNFKENPPDKTRARSLQLIK